MNAHTMHTFIGVALLPEGANQQEFGRQWITGYLPLVQRLPGLRAYRWNVAAERVARASEVKFDPMAIGGFSQFAFAPGTDIAQVMASDAGQALRAFERRLLAEHMVLEVEELLVIEPPPSPPKPGAIKTMSILRRAQGASMEEFLHEWRAVHIPKVRAIRQMKGYRQSLILRRLRDWITPVDDTVFPFDGAVELWYDSVEDVQAAAASPQAQEAFTHAERSSSRIERYQISDIHEWRAA